MESKNYYPPSSKKGFVYILSNISMPGIIKVGRTGKVPELRIKDKDLCSTGVPTPFVAEYYAFFDNMYEAEKKAHINLRVYSHGKEFFKVDIPTAIKQIERIKIDSIEIYPNKGGLSHIAFDDIQKRCPNCSKVNIIPEYIKHDKRPICAHCHFMLLDKVNIIQKVNTVHKIVEVEKIVEIEKIVEVKNIIEVEKIVPVEKFFYTQAPQVFKSIIKGCPACKRKNKIPEYIRYGKKHKCSGCGYLLVGAIFHEKEAESNGTIESVEAIETPAESRANISAVNYGQDNKESLSTPWGCLILCLIFILAITFADSFIS